jgi:hypothetical protein
MSCVPGSPRTGGRQKGTLNKNRDEVRQLIEAACPGWNPLQAMARAAMTGSFPIWDHETDAPMIDPDTGVKAMVPISDKTRAHLLKELNEYCHSKRRAIEIQDPDGNPVDLGLAIEFVESPTK